MSKKEKTKNITGWLLFFIITLVIISPFLNLYTLFTQLESLGFASIIESLAMVSLFILAGIFLWKKKPYALRFAKVFLITQGAINVGMFFFYSYSPKANLFSFFGYFLVWALYLYNSKKVKKIYGNLKEKSSGLQIWPILAIIYAFIFNIFGIIFSVIALINISKNKKLKGFALSIVALVISIIVFGGFLAYGFLAVINEGSGVPEEIEIPCHDYCYDVSGAVEYSMEYNVIEESYMCSCLDEFSGVIEQKVYPYIQN
ncbi:MAG: hypothetical protein ABIJ20_03650 [Nanoarchaeota archaeon]|nr:hypothetical protein [Nanoarchaeota archaeon]MBU1444774.1 hypothetical protein [Nanoarchaeota archaeon]MBU2420062.1 hypothetical protein [Nanoarchaeota archaeon]MBU2474903.1 hypothetical protein [Nanoarchaeota archaeon]